MSIKNLIEGQRGCGFRKSGGLYLMGGAGFSGCCALPAALHVCPTCGNGIKFTRGFSWISPKLLTDNCTTPGTSCILANPPEKIGLMWVGEKYYNTTQHFITEAQTMGISKRIAQIPNDCKVGETWIALAHKKGITKYGSGDLTSDHPHFLTVEYIPAVFMLFKLTGIQYVVNGEESEEELQRLEKRGVDLVTITKAGEQQNLHL